MSICVGKLQLTCEDQIFLELLASHVLLSTKIQLSERLSASARCYQLLTEREYSAEVADVLAEQCYALAEKNNLQLAIHFIQHV